MNNKKRLVGIVLAAIMMISIFAAIVSTGGEIQSISSVSRHGLASSEEAIPGQAIVGFKDVMTMSVEQNALIGKYDGAILDRNHVLNCVLVKVDDTQEFVTAISRDASVKYAEPNYIVRALYTPIDPYYYLQWGLPAIKADLAWDTEKGDYDNITIAIVDTGIDYNHEDLGNYVSDGYDWVNDDNDPWDDNGHGTHCAGIAAAVMDNGIGVAGIAQVKVMAEKVLNETGYGSNWNVSRGVINATDQGADIISLSLGSYETSYALEDACQYAWDEGCILTAAAGNDNIATIMYPAKYDTVICVGAINQLNQRCDYLGWWGSNWGPEMDLVAPGHQINSSTPYNNYASWDGTSMATPHIAGVAALVWSNCPELTNQQVRDRLDATADDLGITGWDEEYGYGKVDAEEAIECEIVPQPDIWVDPTSFEMTLNQGDTWSDILKIGNDGEATLTYNITDIETTGGPCFKWVAQDPDPLPAGEGGIIEAEVHDPDGLGDIDYVKVWITQNPSDGGYIYDDGVPPDETAGDSIYTGQCYGTTMYGEEFGILLEAKDLERHTTHASFTFHVDIPAGAAAEGMLAFGSSSEYGISDVETTSASKTSTKITSSPTLANAVESITESHTQAVELKPSEPISFAVLAVPSELIYDDGEADATWAWYNPCSLYAVRFTPPSYPVELDTARICIWGDWPDSDHEEFAVEVYDDDGSGGAPGTLLGTVNTTATGWGWHDVDISGLGITLTSGDFYIAYHQLTAYPDCEGLCIDTDEPDYARSWKKYDGEAWEQLPIPGGEEGNWMIRCVVELMEDCSWLDENPNFGSVDPSSYDEINVTINTTDLAPGEYCAEIWIANNDPDENPTIVPVSLTVKPVALIFDTEQPKNPYPSIFGTHNGTITPNVTIYNVSRLYTYPCAGTGGHSESVAFFNATTEVEIANGTWNGYQGAGDYHYIELNMPFDLQANVIYNYTIRTGSYPQIFHNMTLATENGWINCTEFTDANGKEYTDWIPAIRLE